MWKKLRGLQNRRFTFRIGEADIFQNNILMLHRKEELQEDVVVAESDKEAPVPNDEEDKELKEESSERGFWHNMLIRVIGVLIFAAIFFGIYYFSRLKYR